MPSTAINRPSRFGPASRVRTMKTSGISMPLPNPCTTRKAISSVMLGAIAHSSDPRVKASTDPMKSRLVPNRSAAHPVSGITVASASVLPVMVHATTAWVVWNSVMKVRCATLTTVVSSAAITAASTHTPAILRRLASRSSGCSPGLGFTARCIT